MTTHPFRFGVQSSAPMGPQEWSELARTAENLGYDILTMADHLVDHLAIGPALTAAALATTTLKVGSVVHCNDFRHPVMLAKELATIDLLSEGRLEYGLGAGWMRSEYDAMGIAYDRPGVRLDRLEETLAIVPPLLSGARVTHHGEHHQITDVRLDPAPVQTPPRLFIGGGGRRMLGIAARHADVVGLNFNLNAGQISPDLGPDGTAARTDEKIAWIRSAVGSNTPEIQTRVHHTSVHDDEVAATAGARRLGLDTEAALDSPHVLAGPVTGLIDTILARRERWGVNYLTVNATSMHELAPVVAALAGS